MSKNSSESRIRDIPFILFFRLINANIKVSLDSRFSQLSRDEVIFSDFVNNHLFGCFSYQIDDNQKVNEMCSVLCLSRRDAETRITVSLFFYCLEHLSRTDAMNKRQSTIEGTQEILQNIR